jgi:two-component system cell cycle response regulator
MSHLSTPSVENPGRVLVVDDARTVRRLLTGFLRRAGYQVFAAADGEEALARLAQRPIDVVVTDLNMPRRGGLELLEAVRQLEQPPEVIILTGTHAEDIQAAIRALRLGAHDYLTKPPSSLEEVALAVERALEKKRLREEMARLLVELSVLSHTDGLTQVGNRRALDEALVREGARSRRHRFPLSLVLVDIDHFKRINDELGHRAGDQALRLFAHRLHAIVRSADRLFRYGGEEFAVLLPHASLCGAEQVADRIVACTSEARFGARHRLVRLTCSAGVASLRPGEEPEALLDRADAALYRAKERGRNQVCSDDDAERRAGESRAQAGSSVPELAALAWIA